MRSLWLLGSPPFVWLLFQPQCQQPREGSVPGARPSLSTRIQMWETPNDSTAPMSATTLLSSSSQAALP